MKAFFSAASLLLLLIGLGWLLLPEAMFGRWGVHGDAVGVFVARRYGSMLLGYAAILWLGRTSGPSVARTAILGGAALVAGVLAVVGLAGVVRGVIGPGGWVTVVVEALLAAGFLYFLLSGRRQEP